MGFDMNKFVQEKDALHIDDAVNQVLALINEREFIKSLEILEPLSLEFEKGEQLENSEDGEFYSFADNIECFTKVIENAHSGKTTNVGALNPSYARMYHLLGYVYEELENTDAAVEALKKAIRWNPVSAGTYLELGEIYKKASNWEEFLPLIKNALKYSKTPATFARALRGLGYYYCEQKEYDIAVGLYMHSLQFEDNREVVGTEVGYMYEMSGKTLNLPDPDEAVQVLIDNNIDAEMSNYAFAGYARFLQVLKESNQAQAYEYYEDALKKMIFSKDKQEYLTTL